MRGQILLGGNNTTTKEIDSILPGCKKTQRELGVRKNLGPVRSEEECALSTPAARAFRTSSGEGSSLRRPETLLSRGEPLSLKKRPVRTGAMQVRLLLSSFAGLRRKVVRHLRLVNGRCLDP